MLRRPLTTLRLAGGGGAKGASFRGRCSSLRGAALAVVSGKLRDGVSGPRRVVSWSGGGGGGGRTVSHCGRVACVMETTSPDGGVCGCLSEFSNFESQGALSRHWMEGGGCDCMEGGGGGLHVQLGTCSGGPGWAGWAQVGRGAGWAWVVLCGADPCPGGSYMLALMWLMSKSAGTT